MEHSNEGFPGFTSRASKKRKALCSEKVIVENAPHCHVTLLAGRTHGPRVAHTPHPVGSRPSPAELPLDCSH